MTDDKGAMDKMKDALEKIRSCLPKDPNQSVFPWTANKLKKIIDEALGCPCGDFDEKPYTAGLPGNAAVIDNRLGCAYTGIEERSVNAVCSWMNEAYAEGRKAAEKEQAEQKWLGHTAQDFRELLDLANQLRKYPVITADKFDAWKKARGIENRIRGGQDGE